MKTLVCLFLFLVPCLAENFLLNGEQTSVIDYKMTQEITPSKGIKELVLSYVVARSFRSPSYRQEIKNYNLDFSIKPVARYTETDKRGNEIITVKWNNPKKTITNTLSFTAHNTTSLQILETDAPFPPGNFPAEIAVYLQSTRAVPANYDIIKQKARQLAADSQTQFDAVQKILTWIVDYMNYILNPESFDALYAIKTQKGNCQNYSHLAATFLRAVGIPVRIVNGVTIKEPYDVKLSNGTLTMRMAQGRHSWIEVYFPDMGWVPFDPQQMQMFVSNRFIRIEIGVDNDETIADGSVRWTRVKGSSGQVAFRETYDAKFVTDNVNLFAERTDYGPRKMLFTPEVETMFSQATIALAAAPSPMDDGDIKTLKFNEPFEFGNLDFPADADFLQTRSPATTASDGALEMRKNFLVETAEYVTTKGHQYAQIFMLEKPLQLENIGLALHKFGGDGQLWVEVYRDDGTGVPGEHITTSVYKTLESIPLKPGYRWVNFDFDEKNVLVPGRYWLALGFTGSPIVNWFFSYGKPSGIVDGTRYKTVFDETWGRYLNYEFNYRIVGKTGS
ncbi:transglutaminase domain-containing protein [candidate division KSB1 bacterium]|nr:transglutaminase domain-containing protein [candidate division KSB1 bacterium]